MNNQFGKGIALATNFDLSAQIPLDSRLVVDTIEDRDNHVTNNRAYMGLMVYVKEDNKTYQYKLNTLEDGSKVVGWGALEGDVIAKDFESVHTSDINFSIVEKKSLKKNNKDFFPITHEEAIYDSKGINIPAKYQTINDTNLKTNNKTIVGGINELHSSSYNVILTDEQVTSLLQGIDNNISKLNI